jgi:toxin ParE1/3/4
MSARRVRVALSSEARDDLESIYLYGYHKWGEAAAERYVTRIAEALDALARFPRLGRRSERRADEGYVLTVSQHIIVYRFEGDEVLVTRILHQRAEIDGLSEDP